MSAYSMCDTSMRAAAAASASALSAGEARAAASARGAALRWAALNGALLLLFAYDLAGSGGAACGRSALHYLELALAGALAAALLHHARRACHTGADAADARKRTLAVSGRLASPRARAAASAPAPAPASPPACEAASLSLSPRRAWSASPPPSPSPGGAPRAPSPATPPPPDRFIADGGELALYLSQYEERGRRAEGAGAGGVRPGAGAAGGGGGAPRYQLALSLAESGAAEEAGAGGCAGGALGPGAGAGPGAAHCAPAAPHVWWQLGLDPDRLTQYNQNLRLWLHSTIVSRVSREVCLADASLSRHGLHALRLGELSVERLRALASAAGAGSASGAGALAALLPFLEPFADQRYAVRRIRELSRGSCLSAYRWCGGGAGWTAALPTDAELVLALLGAYLDVQLSAPHAPNAFTARHVCTALPAGPVPPGAGPQALCIRLVQARPPHYVLCLPGGGAVSAGAGRNNLLHTVLLFLAAAATTPPPAPALPAHVLAAQGVNMLWIIGR